jgi:hypothetical protein
MNTQPFDLDDVLDSLMLEESKPSYAVLTRWTAQYPQFAEALAEFFAEWAIQSEHSEETEIDTERLSNLAVSHALDILHRRGSKQQSAGKAGAVGLLKAIVSIGATAQSIAAELGLDEVLLKKLDLRRLTQVPEQLCKGLGERLRVSAEDVRSMVAGGPPLVNAAVQYKAKGKPLPSTETFIHAIQHSSLSDDQKAHWAKVVQAADRENNE